MSFSLNSYNIYTNIKNQPLKGRGDYIVLDVVISDARVIKFESDKYH